MDIETIEFGDFQFNPTEIKVDDDPVMVIRFRVKKDKEFHPNFIKYFFSEKNYFDVKINGEDTRSMRFGKPSYSEHDKEIKYTIILVSKGYDDYQTQNHGKPLNRIDTGLKKLAVGNHSTINVLLEKLRSKDIFSAEEIEEIRKESKKKGETDWFKLYRTDDLDKYAL